MLNPIAAILMTVLAVAGYFGVYQSAAAHVYSRRTLPILAVVVLFLYGCAVAFVLLLYFFFGSDPAILYGALLTFAILGLALIVSSCVRSADSMNWTMVVLFLLYGGVVAYATIFMRVGTVSKSIRMEPCARILKAIETGDFSAMQHDLLNMLMFVPLGILIPLMNSKALNKFGTAFLFGLISSVSIETIQLVTHLGVCDIDDIIANTVGAVVGYACSAFYLRVRKNWRL